MSSRQNIYRENRLLCEFSYLFKDFLGNLVDITSFKLIFQSCIAKTYMIKIYSFWYHLKGHHHWAWETENVDIVHAVDCWKMQFPKWVKIFRTTTQQSLEWKLLVQNCRIKVCIQQEQNYSHKTWQMQIEIAFNGRSKNLLFLCLGKINYTPFWYHDFLVRQNKLHCEKSKILSSLAYNYYKNI